MRPASVSGNVTGDALVYYWSIFAPVPSNSPRRLCESSLGPVSFSFLKWRIHRQTCLLTTLSQVLQFTRQHQ